jgi:parvulin-like peptidyl-prolyl isomerase
MKEIEELGFDNAALKIANERRAVVSAYGWTKPGVFKNEIASAMDNLKIGTHGGPYQTKDGYYIVRVKDRKKETVKSLKEASNDIKALLRARKQRATVAHWIAEKKKTALIIIN